MAAIDVGADAAAARTIPESETETAWRLSFEGSRPALFALVLRVGLLTALTLGIYRFWARTRIRQYLWSAIRIGGDTLEYHGRASELLIGFLIALAILAPLFIAHGVITNLVLGPESVAAAVFQLIWLLILFALYAAAIFRMTRYRLSRTSWRGIRFGLDGSTLAFTQLFLGYGLLTLVTLGVAYPWFRQASIAYRVNHARFGSAPFAFEGSARPLLGPWLPVLGTFVLALVILIVAVQFGMPTDAGGDTSGEMEFKPHPSALLALPLLLLVFPILFVRYRVREFCRFAACARLGAARISSNLRTKPIVLASVLNAIAIIGVFNVTFFVVGPIVAVLFGGPGGEAGDLSFGAPPVFLIVLFVLLLLIFAVFPAIGAALVVHTIIAEVCASTTIDNPGAFEAAARSTAPGPTYGEGLADAFDVGAI